MPTLPGFETFGGVRIMANPACSPALRQFSNRLWRQDGIALHSAPSLGALICGIPLQQGISLRGLIAEGGGQELFEKIIVSPRLKDCGFVLADVQWKTVVWNTHRAAPRTLASFDLQDSGNVVVDNPAGLPLIIAPMHSRSFTTTVPRDGDATIQAVLTFVVIGESDTNVRVLGTRIIVFPIDPDWSESPTEKTQFLTDIMTAYNGSEQRASLRTQSRTQFAYQVLTLSAQETATLEAVLFGWQSSIYGIPFWPDAQPITRAANAGDKTLYCATQYRRFRAGGIACLWRDYQTSEAVSVVAVAGDSITISAPLNGSFPADGRTYLIPVLPARINGEAAITHISGHAAQATLTFNCEVV